jgi:hypothetical protein
MPPSPNELAASAESTASVGLLLPEHARELAREGGDHVQDAGHHAGLVLLLVTDVVARNAGLFQDSISFLDSHL